MGKTCPKPCPPDKICNPASNRCVKKTGAVGMGLVSGTASPRRHGQGLPPDVDDKITRFVASPSTNSIRSMFATMWIYKHVPAVAIMYLSLALLIFKGLDTARFVVDRGSNIVSEVLKAVSGFYGLVSRKQAIKIVEHIRLETQNRAMKSVDVQQFPRLPAPVALKNTPFDIYRWAEKEAKHDLQLAIQKVTKDPSLIITITKSMKKAFNDLTFFDKDSKVVDFISKLHRELDNLKRVRERHSEITAAMA